MKKKRRGSVAATIAVVTEENATNKKTWLTSHSMLQDFVRKRQKGTVHPLQAEIHESLVRIKGVQSALTDMGAATASVSASARDPPLEQCSHPATGSGGHVASWADLRSLLQTETPARLTSLEAKVTALGNVPRRIESIETRLGEVSGQLGDVATAVRALASQLDGTSLSRGTTDERRISSPSKARLPTRGSQGGAQWGSASNAQGPLIEVVIPEGVRSGDVFLIEFEQAEYQVVAPHGCAVGDLVQIAVSGQLARLLRDREDQAAAATRIAAVVRGKRARRLTVEINADAMVVQELALIRDGAAAEASGRGTGAEEERDPDLRI